MNKVKLLYTFRVCGFAKELGMVSPLQRFER
jgi:hypothetical protein